MSVCIYVSVYLCVCVSVYLSVCVSVYLYVSVCLSVHLCVSVSVCVPVCWGGKPTRAVGLGRMRDTREKGSCELIRVEE